MNRLSKYFALGMIQMVAASGSHAQSPELDEKVLALLEETCAECHRDDEDPELHAGIDLYALYGDTSVVSANSPDESDLYKRVIRPENSSRRMPASDGEPGDPDYRKPLTTAQKALLEEWIKVGPAPRKVVADTVELGEEKPVDPEPKEATEGPADEARAVVELRSIYALVRDDLDALPAARRATARYFTFVNLANARSQSGLPLISDQLLERYRAALSKTLNSVSRAGDIALPVFLGEGRLVARVQIDDYAISSEDWEDHVAAGYPYAVTGFGEEGEIVALSGSQVPLVRADWFVFAATQPPLYNDLLKLPKKAEDLEETLRVDVNLNLKEGRAIRAGFRDSGVSSANRLIERHRTGDGGYYWKSYDFTPNRASDPRTDLFVAPLGPPEAKLTPDKSLMFAHDGGEMIFSLPNGMQGYLLTTADGDRIDRAPSEIVNDRNRRDGAIINGISCIKCHSQGMQYPPDKDITNVIDEVRPVVQKASLPFNESRMVEKLYAEPEDLRKVMLEDEKSFREVLSKVAPGFDGPVDPVGILYERYREPVNLESAAAELGVTPERLAEKVDDCDDRDVHLIHAQLASGSVYPRQLFEQHFRRLADAIHLRVRAFDPIPYEEFGGAKELNEVVAAANDTGKGVGVGGLTLEIDKDRYNEGDALEATIGSKEKSLYVRLYNIAPDGSITQLFPNKRQENNFIKKGDKVVVPELPEGRGKLRIREPLGTEVLVAVGMPVPFNDDENFDFDEGDFFKTFKRDELRALLGRGTRKVVFEDDDGKTRPAPVSHASVAFTTEK